MKLAVSINEDIKNNWLINNDSWVFENQSSPYRFIKSALDIFGRQDVALISPKDFINYSVDKNIDTVYLFNESNKGIIPKQMNLECDVLFYLDDNGLLPGFRLKDLQDQHDVYKHLISQGRIGHMINTIESKEKNNKAKFPQYLNGISLPRTYQPSSISELEEILRKENELVAKHVFGSDSAYVKLHNIQDSNYFEKINVYDNQFNEWVFQQKIDIYSEIRMVFLDGEIVGTREIVNRLKPWEDNPQGEVIKRVYVPDQKIISETLKISRDLGMEFGCVDWIVDKNGKRLFLEANDAGTGLNPQDEEGNYIYDITSKVPEYIYNKYFK